MTGIYTFLKSQALKRLPDEWLGALKAWHYRRALRTFDERDEPDMAILRWLVDPGTTAVDVGANVGIYTKLLSELVGGDGSVVSIEPIPTTCAILRGNVEALGLRNVHVVQAAASNAPGSAVMEIPEYASGGRNFYEAAIVSEPPPRGSARAARVEVRLCTLDQVVAGAGRVGFVKCDVEGHEAACVEGAGGMIAREKPSWLIEISGNPDAPGRTATLFEHLAGFGYAPWFLDGQTLRARRTGDRSTNYFFLTPAHVETLRRRAPDLVSGADS